MAGRKQHFIPRHFLKEFVIPDGSDKLWMYRRELKKPVPVSRDDAAATRDFYSKPSHPDTPTLDDLITDYEENLQHCVDRVRSIPAGSNVPTELISEIVVHLTLRAAYLREFIEEGVLSLITSISEAIENPSDVFKNVSIPKHRPPDKFDDLLLEQFEKHQVSSYTKISFGAISRLFYIFLRENKDDLYSWIVNEFSKYLDLFKDGLGGVGRKAHINVLEKDLAPAPRKALLEELEWKVVDYPSGDAVLPDCVAIAKDDEGWGPYLLSSHKSLTLIIIPLSSSKLAVGSTTSIFEEVAKDYNQAARSSCFRFYLSNQQLIVKEDHLSEIGSPARKRISEMTSSAVLKAVEDFVEISQQESLLDGSLATWESIEKRKEFSCSVTFRDFGDESYRKEVADNLVAIIRAFADLYPIHKLDGITFADDYAVALKELNRGEGVSNRIYISDEKDKVGLAMPLAVRRDNSVRTHITIRGSLADYLISSDQNCAHLSISTIWYCLGTVAFNTLLDEKFPNLLLSPHSNIYEGWLYQHNDALLATYFSTRLLRWDQEQVKSYESYCLSSLEKFITETSDAQLKYEEDNNHDDFFEVCAFNASGFMLAMARYFGCRALAIGPNLPSSPLEQVLRKFEILKWSRLFQEDLENFISGLNKWSDVEEMYFLNRHLERLLFEVGVFPDLTEQGLLYVHTSLEHRLAGRV